jgi:hypothetical protein
MNDPDAIDAAYVAQLQLLYRTLVSNIITSHDEDDSVDRFEEGLRLARKARELALLVINEGVE